MAAKRILVIGGTRFIGAYVVRDLAAEGHEVTVFHRGRHKAAVLPAVREICDPLAAMPVKKLPSSIRSLEADIVVHMIPMGVEDARTAIAAFRDRAERIVLVSSCDVYLAYGRFRNTEPGTSVATPLTEDSPLRGIHYPYRTAETPEEAYEHDYEKILMEEEGLQSADLPAVVLRLPKVYGHEDNANLATVYGASHAPAWRWTHGFVENVARAISLSATHPRAAGRIYNVGEAVTPTVAERLTWLPRRPSSVNDLSGYNFEQNMDLDTARIRRELGYVEVCDERESMREVVETVLRAEVR